MENAAVNPRFKEILALSVRDRLRLLHAIVDSLEADATEVIELTAAQERELDRRWRKYLRDPSAARTWEEVREDMLHLRGRFASLPKRKRT
jgi:putative addiction module component (TIGR02574 family)